MEKSQLENVIVVIHAEARLMVGTDHFSFILLTYMSVSLRFHIGS